MERRMYGLTNYQLTGIQKGIQFLHGVVEYSQMVNRVGGELLDIYNDWANSHKTVILLNGGTTNHRIDDGLPFGSLNQHVLELQKNSIDFATFNEPDLGDQLTAVVFIVDERVFNRKKYPDFEDWLIENYGGLIKSDTYTTSIMLAKKIKDSKSKRDQKVYNEWTNLIGGKKNIFLREFLKNFKLA
jgi:hypothetical protein